MSRLLVVGSINMDVVNQVDNHPQPGETIKGHGTEYSPGGKGANQAVAASLAGGEVLMLGAVGEDSFGAELISTLQSYKIETNRILKKQGTSGIAFITVDQTGENSIILSEGANGKLSIADIKEAIPVFEGIQAVLLQNEIPWHTTLYTIKLAFERGIHIYLNPAPAIHIPDEIMPMINTLFLNETEAEYVSGITIETEQQARLAAELLIDRGAKQVVITLGIQGSLCVDEDKSYHRVSAYKVKPVDTTAAGDTFIGAFAEASESGMSVKDCLMWAAAASALTVTKQGAQHSIPNKEEIQKFMKENKQLDI